MSMHDTHKPAAKATKISSPVQRAPEQAAAQPEAECTEQTVAPQLAGRLTGQQQARMMQRMQRTVGNAQVQRMLSAAPAQRRPISPPAPAIDSTTSTAQLTTEPVAPVAEVQRAPQPQSIASAPVQRTTAPIRRNQQGWDWNPINAGRRALNAVGNGVQQAGRAAFELAMSRAGVDPGRVMGLIERAGDAIGTIFSDPERFARTLGNAVKQGFGRFQDNISTHLQSGLMGWLVGTMRVNVPRDLSSPSVLSLVLEVLGINQRNLLTRVAQQAGAGNTAQIQAAQSEIRALTRNGLSGLWPMLQGDLGNLKSTVIDSLQRWVTASIVRSAIGKIASMFNPASGLIAIIRTIYDVIVFVMDYFRQIQALTDAVYGSVRAIAQGNTQQASVLVERALAGSVPVAIGVLASVAGVTRVAQTVRETIGRVRSNVESAVNRMITRLLGRSRSGSAQGGGRPAPAQSNPASGQHRLRQSRVPGRENISDSRIGQGRTRSGTSRTTREWRGRHGPGAPREHHLIPQALLRDRRFTSRLQRLGIPARALVDRNIVIIPQGSHSDLHTAGWNDDWLDWLRANPNFTRGDIENQIQSMIRRYNIPRGSRNFVRTYRRNRTTHVPRSSFRDWSRTNNQ